MLKNYFKIAIAVLKRRKFFTFISLFGISFTLTILIVATAFVDSTVSTNYPDTNRDRSLYVTMVQQMDEKHGGQMNGPASFHYFDHYVRQMKTPEKMGIATLFSATNTYVNNKKLVINIKHTNDEFWDVMQYRFLEGKPYTKQQVAAGERVVVITEDTKKAYFGDEPSVVGKTIEADNVPYRVSGVVQGVPITRPLAYADLFAPYTVSKKDYRRKGLMGEFTGILMAPSSADLDKMRNEYASIVAKVKPEDPNFSKFVSHADRYVASFIRNSPLGSGDDGGVGKLIFICSLFVFLFMLLPTLNLVNINISRIMERSSEIGVRKAFGASSRTLVGQFIVENLVLTFLGCLIGVVLSAIILQVLNRSDLIANMELSINGTVLLLSMLACLVFGLLSGVYPAWRMSRLHVVSALKA